MDWTGGSIDNIHWWWQRERESSNNTATSPSPPEPPDLQAQRRGFPPVSPSPGPVPVRLTEHSRTPTRRKLGGARLQLYIWQNCLGFYCLRILLPNDKLGTLHFCPSSCFTETLLKSDFFERIMIIIAKCVHLKLSPTPSVEEINKNKFSVKWYLLTA